MPQEKNGIEIHIERKEMREDRKDHLIVTQYFRADGATTLILGHAHAGSKNIVVPPDNTTLSHFTVLQKTCRGFHRPLCRWSLAETGLQRRSFLSKYPSQSVTEQWARVHLAAELLQRSQPQRVVVDVLQFR